MTDEHTPDEAVDAPLEDAEHEPDPEADEDENGAENGADESPKPQASKQVRDLRREAANYRTRLRETEATVDTLQRRLHTELVRATGRLADPTDLAFDPDHLEDGDALTAAVDELLASKPHLAARKPRGDIGQGAGAPSTNSVSLSGLLRAGAS